MTGVKTDQLNVRYRLWRGRVHCTLARDPSSNSDVTVTSLGGKMRGGGARLQANVFSDRSVGDKVKARVVRIRERPVLRYRYLCGSLLLLLLFLCIVLVLTLWPAI